MLSAMTFAPVSFNQEVNVVGRDHIIENGKAVTVLGLEHPNVNSAVDHAQTLVEIFFDGSGA